LAESFERDAVGFKSVRLVVYSARKFHPVLKAGLIGGEGKFGECEFFFCEDAGDNDVNGFEVSHSVVFKVADDAFADDPAGRVVVHEKNEVHGFTDVYVPGFVVIHKVFHGKQRRLPAEGKDGGVDFFGDLFKTGKLSVFFANDHDVPVAADANSAGVVVEEAHVFVPHDVVVADEFNKHSVEDVGLFFFRNKGFGAGKNRFDVGIPKGADDALDRLRLGRSDLLPGLPDNIFGGEGEVDGVRITRAKFFDEPFAGLVVDGDFVGADPFLAEDAFQTTVALSEEGEREGNEERKDEQEWRL